MKSEAKSVEEYLTQVPDERAESFKKLYEIITQNLPAGFHNQISYGMIGWSIPLETYPPGYHCTPNTPLPFINLASQKNFIALYHMGIYGSPELLNWFVAEYPKYSKRKLNMGKSCIRFKKVEDIPFQLIAELCQKITPKDWITLYEKEFKKK
ncbi:MULTISPECIES: DUF1801 domain-containing protein [unclassified Kaistella]|uniref:DUF1801 domain-containing protein n=1 Tax=unclassified Kaistella TaxID=2762626 RepID=UPI00273555E5|nr:MULTISPECIES: DUF1801 domain-containing protein [unclassified Kaistella]MDP2453456.1 DUF1801 domain-containing protein [Kaistella sp. SH11-4b]MDP2456513.1 DUF1801 domain-containing protein [Kaistella sp. SH40-3]MDP2459269.1 DUF1801 domain-containing protein [Kaistella sp. SH19-2b]